MFIITGFKISIGYAFAIVSSWLVKCMDGDIYCLALFSFALLSLKDEYAAQSIEYVIKCVNEIILWGSSVINEN